MTTMTSPGGEASTTSRGRTDLHGPPRPLAATRRPISHDESAPQGRDLRNPYAESCPDIESEIHRRLARVGHAWD